jgi:hypothetical protein
LNKQLLGETDMPVIDLTKTEIYRKAMEPVMEAHRGELAAMGYSLEKDGWELCEYIAYHCLGGKECVPVNIPNN